MDNAVLFEFGAVPRKKRSALAQNGQQAKEGWTNTAHQHLGEDSEDSEREHEVAEVLFDLANMFPPAAPPPANQPASRKRDLGAVTNAAPLAVPEALSKFAKRCSNHVYIAAFIKYQQEQERATLGTLPNGKAEWRMPPDPAAIAAFSAAAAAAAAAAGAGVPALPPFIAAAVSHPLHSAAAPLLVPPPGQLSAAPLAHLPAPPPLAPLLTPQGFFFPPGAAPFPGAPTGPPFVPGAGPTALSIFGPAPFMQAGFPAAALSHLAAADAAAAVAASLAPPVPVVRVADTADVKLQPAA